MMNSLEILRAETQMDHRETESASFMKDFFSPALDRESYKSTLLKLAQVLVPIEKALDSSPYLSRFPSVRRRPAAELLLQDLRQLGLENFEIQAEPRYENAVDLVGALYVVEGAANGGKIIFNRLKSHADEEIKNSISYFAYQAESQERRWADFKNEISKLDLSLPENREAVQAAKETFRRFIL